MRRVLWFVENTLYINRRQLLHVLNEAVLVIEYESVEPAGDALRLARACPPRRRRHARAHPHPHRGPTLRTRSTKLTSDATCRRPTDGGYLYNTFILSSAYKNCITYLIEGVPYVAMHALGPSLTILRKGTGSYVI